MLNTATPHDTADRHTHWIETAENLTPVLFETAQTPLAVVTAQADAGAALGYHMLKVADIGELEHASFSDGDSFILDFGGHRTGHLSFYLGWTGKGVDAPARLRLTFGEVPSDVAESAYPHQGWLSGAWIADELINVDFLPQQVRLPRRYAFRYVKVEVIYTSRNFNVTFSQIKAHALTSAGEDRGRPASFASPQLQRIDEVSLATLRDCMQTSFEDGPKRDQRLWIGDLRLQALANAASFEQYGLVKRCLYLFAGMPREDGFLTACVYEKPAPRLGQVMIVDYAALFGSTVLEYCRASGDWATGHELWPVVARQMDLVCQYLDADGLFIVPEDEWVFIDWREGLDKSAAIQGLTIYTLRHAYELACALGLEHEVAGYPARIEKMVSVARERYFDAALGCFVSGPQRQVSWASQIWLSLARVVDDATATRAMTTVMRLPEAVKPQTPYLYHYLLEALFDVGANGDARTLIEQYWGGMVDAGADTFWEAYDPQDPLTSPYGSKHVNSYCHAWSCTPVYFIRKYLS